MNKYKIELSIPAFYELKSIGDYISYTLMEPDTSKKFIKGLRASISTLSTFPYRYPPINPDNKHQITRCMPYKNYDIFYSICEATKTISITTIGYNKRNWIHILRL